VGCVLLAAGCGKKSTNPTTSLLGVPILISINGATQPSGSIGSTVLVEGQGFGASQGSGRVLFSDGSGGEIAATIADPADWTDTYILTTVPDGTATGPAWVETAGGASDSLTFTVTANPTFSPSTITWTSTTQLPVGLSGHAAVFVKLSALRLAYVIGGADSTQVPNNVVRFASVASDGHLSAWTSTTGLPGSVAFHAAVAATPANSRVEGNGYLYVLGGATDSTGTPTAAIYRGALNADGTVASWTLAGSLPASLHSLGAAIFNGNLYVAGGATTGNAPVSSVYRCRIETTGGLGGWATLASLPAASRHHAFFAFGGYLYVMGGETGTMGPNDPTNSGTMLDQVAYAKIDLRTGAFPTGWTLNGAVLIKAVRAHTGVVGGGYALVSAGVYNGNTTGSTEQSYAQLNSDGSVGSFNGATGAHTIVFSGGDNLFNHAALSYVDAAGVAHVMVIGGDDVNAPGSKRPEIWFY
jgi:hypothetical protein